MSELSIPVSSIDETPRRFRLEAGPTWWDEHGPPHRAAGERVLEPFTLVLEVYRLGRRILARGELRGRVELACGRCTERLEHTFREPVSLLLEPAPEGAAVAEGGIELDPEDLELAQYSGDELDFGIVVLETLLTSWPMQPLCSEACRGLCPACGADRNRAPCGCEERAGSRPFESLKELLAPGRGASKTPSD